MRSQTNRCHGPVWLLGLGIVLPTITTYIYFYALADHSDSLQKAAMAAGKIMQFALPVIWLMLRIPNNQPEQGEPRKSLRSWELPLGLLTGLVASVGILLLYHGLLKGQPFLMVATKEVQEKVTELGFGSPIAFVGLSVFYVILHSLLEEYYWRWFIYSGLRTHSGIMTAVTISSLGFMAHHVLVLANYFGWYSPATYLFSFFVAFAGAVWAWTYERTGTLYAPWLSHALADAVIFAVGFDMIRSTVN